MMPHHAVLDGCGNLYLAYNDWAGPNDVKAGAVWRHNMASGAWTNVSPPHKGRAASAESQPTRPIRARSSSRRSISGRPARSSAPRTAGRPGWSSSSRRRGQWRSGLWRARSGCGGTATTCPRWDGWATSRSIRSTRRARSTSPGKASGPATTSRLPTAAAPTHWKFDNDGLEETVPLDLVSPPAGRAPAERRRRHRGVPARRPRRVAAGRHVLRTRSSATRSASISPKPRRTSSRAWARTRRRRRARRVLHGRRHDVDSVCRRARIDLDRDAADAAEPGHDCGVGRRRDVRVGAARRPPVLLARPRRYLDRLRGLHDGHARRRRPRQPVQVLRGQRQSDVREHGRRRDLRAATRHGAVRAAAAGVRRRRRRVGYDERRAVSFAGLGRVVDTVAASRRRGRGGIRNGGAGAELPGRVPRRLGERHLGHPPLRRRRRDLGTNRRPGAPVRGREVLDRRPAPVRPCLFRHRRQRDPLWRPAR